MSDPTAISCLQHQLNLILFQLLMPHYLDRKLSNLVGKKASLHRASRASSPAMLSSGLKRKTKLRRRNMPRGFRHRSHIDKREIIFSNINTRNERQHVRSVCFLVLRDLKNRSNFTFSFAFFFFEKD